MPIGEEGKRKRHLPTPFGELGRSEVEGGFLAIRPIRQQRWLLSFRKTYIAEGLHSHPDREHLAIVKAPAAATP